jgi:hypothetical protein
LRVQHEAAQEAERRAAEAETMAAQYADEDKAFDSAYYADMAVKLRTQADDARDQAHLQVSQAWQNISLLRSFRKNEFVNASKKSLASDL